MTGDERREKLNWLIFMVGYFVAGYLTVNHLAAQRGVFFSLVTDYDRIIPFNPIFIFGYTLVYLSIAVVYVTIDDIDDWRRTVVSFLIATSVAYLIFFLFPVKMELRPDLTNLPGASNAVTRVYYFIDLPYNCFPSLHVIYPTLATLLVWRRHKIMRWVLCGMAAVVAASVMLVKQHYVADVVGGFVSAWLCFWITTRSETLWCKWFAD